MVEERKEAVGSMGDDTPLAVLSDKYRAAVAFLPAEFQPGHQSADRSLREKRVMTLKTRLRQSRQHPGRRTRAQAEVLLLESPGAVHAACTQRLKRSSRRPPRDRLHLRVRDGGRRTNALARRDPPHPRRGRGRGARGCTICPDRRGMSADRAAIPMILATGAVHAHLVRQRLAHLHLAQRALGRMPRHALFRGADRRRRHHGQRLSGAGDASPTAIARGLFGERDARDVRSRATRARSTTACSRSCRRWASR